ncbi:MAG: hypothetical protein PHE54_04790 [Bacilli bacterium]|nr:hypothetical protein [Bacilli bacterium]
MKKIIIALFVLLTVSGCMSDLTNTPTKQVEMFLAKYQTLDEDVISDLEKLAQEEERFNTEQRDKYISIMKNHYQNITYKIKDETIDGDEATVTVAIEVIDNAKALAEADVYFNNNPEAFYDETDTYSESMFMDYRLELLESNKETVTYTLELTLTKNDGKWQMDQISETNESKINGTYIY